MSLEYLARFRDMLINGMQMEIQVMHFSFSWWEVFLFDVVAGLLASFIIGLLFDD